MSEIKRYDLVCSEYLGGGIGAKDNGKYCLHDDYLEVLKRAEAAEAKLAEQVKRKPDFHVRPIRTEQGPAWIECGADYERGRHFFTRPAPAINLAALVPDGKWINPAPGFESEDSYSEGWNACRAAILRNIAQAPRDEFFKFLKDTSAIVDSWPDWKKQGTDVSKFLNPTAEVAEDSCPKGSVHEWVHHAPCYKPDYEECNKCGQRKECSENE